MAHHFAFCYLFMQIRYYFASFDILFQLFLDRTVERTVKVRVCRISDEVRGAAV